MKNIAVIFAGGTGQRMGSELPKQFLKVCNKEIIIHTLDRFENNEEIDEIYIACKEEYVEYLASLVHKYGIEKVKRIFPGGKTGQDSIFCGLSEVKKDYEDAIVLIHDGVRPIIANEVISKDIESVKEHGSAITSTVCYETPIVSIDGETVRAMPERNKVFTAQAPQCFYLNDIYNAHLDERETNPNYKGIVDSCGLMHKHGYKCHLVEGNRGNIKVTTPSDFFTLIGIYNAEDYAQAMGMPEYEKMRQDRQDLNRKKK